MFSQPQYDALQHGAGMVDRSARGRLILTGTDRRAYLQGILTNDIAALGAGEGCYAALLTPQGRMISDMRVSEAGDHLLIDLPAPTAQAVRQRLTDFIFTEDVEVRDVQAEYSQFGVYGPRAADFLDGAMPQDASRSDERSLSKELGSLPLDANVQRRFKGVPVLLVRSDDFGIPGFEVFVTGSADELTATVREAGAVDVSPGTAQVVRVEAGRPEFGVDMDEHTIPLEAGIEDRAISLTKGCYVGQEVIIRVLHRGHGRVAKNLVGLSADSHDGAIERGHRIHAGGKEIGIVTSAVRSPKLQRSIALGYVHRDFTDPGTRVEIGAGDRVLHASVVSLPFAAPAT
ncbi:MAG: YgfZ/GcvT domain-containing protein [Vicinamibacterales bacterium]